MEHEAGRQERLRDAARDDRRDSQPMRPAPSEIRRNPSTDQLKARKQLKRKTAAEDFPAGRPRGEHQRCSYCNGSGCGHCNWTGGVYASLKTATEVPTSADKLNPGDYIRGANNQMVQVKQVRLHKTDSNQVYVDTESGTFAVPRAQNFTRVVGDNMRQQEMPASIGNPGGNSDVLPMSPGAGGMSPGTSHGKHSCPMDGQPMQLRNSGGNSVWVCPRDGYVMQAAGVPGSGGGGGVTSSPDLMNTMSHKRGYDHEHRDDPIGWLHQHQQVHEAEGDGSFCTRCGAPRSDYVIHTNSTREAMSDKTSAMDGLGAGKTCPLCEGNLKGVGTNVARCEDCGTEVHVQRKQETAAKTASDQPTATVPRSRYAPPLESVIARRARMVLGQEETP